MSELSQLKQEVAALWSRFRREEPLPRDEALREELVLRLRAQEASRAALVERRDALRLQLEQHRRRASRLAPVVRFLGGLVGVGGAAGVLALVPADVLPVVEPGFAGGVTAFLASLLLVGLSLRRAER